MATVWFAFIAGAAAFAHCLGMCGPFALHLGQGGGRAAAFGRLALWNVGKTATYVFLGALAGFAGATLGAAVSWPMLQDVLAYVAGGVMVLAGLSLLGILPRGRKRSGNALGTVTGLGSASGPPAGRGQEPYLLRLLTPCAPRRKRASSRPSSAASSGGRRRARHWRSASPPGSSRARSSSGSWRRRCREGRSSRAWRPWPPWASAPLGRSSHLV
jgi:cytochrome c biogenesis protein CcdA